MRKHLLLTFTLAILLGAHRLPAQASDSIYAGRDCINRLKTLRMPALTELGDSALIDSLLTNAADPKAHITSVEIRYKKDGAFRELNVKGALSKSARDDLRDRLATLLTLRRIPVGPLDLQLIRLTSTGAVRLLAGSTTCEPKPHLTGLQSRIEFIRTAEPEVHVHRDVYVEFILEANGQVSDAWLSNPSGFARVDSLAMQLFRAEAFEPAIVGSAAVPALVVQPFKF